MVPFRLTMPNIAELLTSRMELVFTALPVSYFQEIFLTSGGADPQGGSYFR